MKALIRVLTIVLAVVGFVTLVAAGWVWFGNRRTQPDTLSFINSTDGAFKAAVATYVGGGGISPYCYNRLFVVSGQTPVDRVVDEANLVIEAECGSFAPIDGSAPDPSDVSWREARVLAVRFSILEATKWLKTFRLRRQAGSGQVVVEFEIKQ